VDSHRFDELARAFGAGASRRALLKAALGAVGGLGFASRADARGCRSAGNSCLANQDCCTGLCVAESRTRKVCHCLSDGDCPPPPNECFDHPACDEGHCAAALPRGDGAVCSAGVCFHDACCAPEPAETTCAGGVCGVLTNNCGQAVQCLRLAGEGCEQDGDCCSNVCVDSICQPGPVATGGDCDGNSDCASGTCCSGVCRDLTADPDNCGGCGQVCSGSNVPEPTCGGGVCDGACAPGYDDCDRDKLTNGCETHTASDPDNCGACGHGCPMGGFCQSGECVCPSGTRLCGEECLADELCCVDADCADGNLCTSDVCDPTTHLCSNPAVVCPFDPAHKGNPCWTTACNDPSIGCESMPVADGTPVAGCNFGGSNGQCFNGGCCIAGPGDYACFVDSACCPGYHCVCHNSDPEIGCLNNSGQCELCRHAGAACAQDHECCSESCVNSACVGG
jgi:hypothetical protein